MHRGEKEMRKVKEFIVKLKFYILEKPYRYKVFERVSGRKRNS